MGFIQPLQLGFSTWVVQLGLFNIIAESTSPSPSKDSKLSLPSLILCDLLWFYLDSRDILCPYICHNDFSPLFIRHDWLNLFHFQYCPIIDKGNQSRTWREKRKENSRKIREELKKIGDNKKLQIPVLNSTICCRLMAVLVSFNSRWNNNRRRVWISTPLPKNRYKLGKQRNSTLSSKTSSRRVRNSRIESSASFIWSNRTATCARRRTEWRWKESSKQLHPFYPPSTNSTLQKV